MHARTCDAAITGDDMMNTTKIVGQNDKLNKIVDFF